MKTKKQVLDEFARLQKKYADINGFVDLKTYKDGDSTYWSVTLTITAFERDEISWRETVDWTHYSRQREEDDMRNEAQVEAFVKKMEGRVI